MTPESKELFRQAILRVLSTNLTRFGLNEKAIGFMLVQHGFPMAHSDDVSDALGYLSDKTLCEEVLKSISKENRAWRITANGMAYLDERGL